MSGWNRWIQTSTHNCRNREPEPGFQVSATTARDVQQIDQGFDFDPVTHNPLEEDLSAYESLSIARDRAELYRFAEKNGVGITVMKSLGAGRLLDARTSPFKQALSVPQYHYRFLEHRASECIECGSCEENCPLQVAVRQKMKEAVQCFGV